ncbi:unnamed protein product [Paramecium octaurelia]|uniref:SKP1-like protein n=1 Tax=Paramecium octaurelia TaxID=43137 RepID=A0A8S1S7U4_PAROT|nr:unnamed protein product [Paramecium octaurelia]
MQFISQDGQTFKIGEQALKHCTKVNNTNLEVFNLTGIKSSILKKVIQYCQMHQNVAYIPQISKPLKSKAIYDIVDFQDAEFITELDLEEIFQIIQAAEVLGINALVDLSCAFVALQIRGKSQEQVKLLFKSNKSKTDEEVQRQRDIDSSAKGEPKQTNY